MPIVTLLDSEWDLSDGLAVAPCPDTNVSLVLSDELLDCIARVRAGMAILTESCPACAGKAYAVLPAPVYCGTLYSSKRRGVERFTKTYQQVLTVSPSRVLYVLESEYSGYRIIYDLTDQLPKQ